MIDADGLRFPNRYERWATGRILDAASGIDDATWQRPNVVGERGIGGIMVHHLGAYQPWRHYLSGSEEQPRPEDGPLIGLVELGERWAAEWAAMDAWLGSLSPAKLDVQHEGTAMWQALLHLFNGTQHRSEVANVLTDVGHSPGDLDLVDFAEIEARRGG